MAYTQLYNYSELAKFFIESDADLDSLDAPAGSIASLVDESKSWRMGPSGEWVELARGGSEGGGGDDTTGYFDHVIKFDISQISAGNTQYPLITSMDEIRSIMAEVDNADKTGTPPPTVLVVGVGGPSKYIFKDVLQFAGPFSAYTIVDARTDYEGDNEVVTFTKWLFFGGDARDGYVVQKTEKYQIQKWQVLFYAPEDKAICEYATKGTIKYEEAISQILTRMYNT